MPNKLLPLNRYGDHEMDRLMNALGGLSFNPQEHAGILREIKTWLEEGVSAPTVAETRQLKLTPGWHCRRFSTFGTEGDEGSVHISRLISKQGLHKWQGVDLDTWKPAPPTQPATPPKISSADIEAAVWGDEE